MKLEGMLDKAIDKLTEKQNVILAGVAIAGVVATAMLASKGAVKAKEIIEKEEEIATDHDEEPLTKKEKAIIKAKCYAPAIVTGGLTVAAIAFNESSNMRKQALIASMYTVSEKALKDYQKKVVEKLGKEVHEEIKEDMAKEKVVSKPVIAQDVIFTNNGSTLCYDVLSGRYFRSDSKSIAKAFNHAGHMMLTDMSISLNELYDMLDMPSIKLGDFLTWDVDDGVFEPKFYSQVTDNDEICLVMDYSIYPKYEVH